MHALFYPSPNRPPPFDTSHMHQIGVTLKDAQVVLEVSDASAEGVSTRDPRRAHPDMPCLPFVLMAEKPVLAGLNLETSRVEENETGNGNQETHSESSSNDEGLSYVDFQHEYRSSNGKYDRNESMDNLFESEQLIHMKSYMPTPAIQSTETELFESARSSIHGSPIKKDISQYYGTLLNGYIADMEPITASSDEAKPSDILDAALLRLAGESNDVPWITTIEEWNAARENRFTRPTSDPNSDGSLDDIPELQTPSSSESSSRSPRRPCDKWEQQYRPRGGRASPLCTHPDWKGHYVGIKDYVDMKQEGARRKEVWEDDMTGHMGEQVVTALRDRLGHMLDHHAMEKGEEELDSRSSKPSMPLGLHPTRAFGAFRLRHSWNCLITCIVRFFGLAPEVLGVELLRGQQCTELTRTRMILLEFIEQSFTLICCRHLTIDTSDIHEKSLPPLPFLNGEENAKLRLVRHTFEKNGNGHIAQIAKRILEFQFAEPQDRVTKENYTMGRHIRMTSISGPISHHRPNRAVIMRVELCPDLLQGTVAYTLNAGNMPLDGEHPFTTSDGGGPTVTMGIHCQTGAASLKRKRDCLG
ncbi:hypothetical protein K438DRAFT_1973260 [Mycena galopus ATCC 62051]|nr:hypothetical protein K438DRAFT_1973260 [Mycena galopus ATCC 62051]